MQINLDLDMQDEIQELINERVFDLIERHLNGQDDGGEWEVTDVKVHHDYVEAFVENYAGHSIKLKGTVEGWSGNDLSVYLS